MRVGWPRIVGAVAALVLLLAGLTVGVRVVDSADAECLLECEEARVECRGSSLLVEPLTGRSTRMSATRRTRRARRAAGD